MGTSSDYSTGTGGVHTPFKRAASTFVRHGGNDRAKRVLARHVATLGGSTVAASSASAGIRSATALAHFGSGLASGGLAPTLESLGLRHLVGSSRFAVLNGLVTVLAGDASTLEAEAARSAVLDVLDELYPGDLETFDDLASATVDQAGLENLLSAFVAAYIYRRVLPALSEKLAQLADPADQRRRDRQLREEIKLVVQLDLNGGNAVQLDWSGPEGQAVIANALSYAYRQMELFGE